MTQVTNPSHDPDRPTYGTGPAYPSSHTRFDDGAGTRQTTSASPARPSEPGAVAGTPGEESAPGEASAPEPYFSPTAEFTIAEGVRDVGMVFVGASTTAGYGDPKGLGWVGRVVARTQHPDLDGIYVTWAEPALSVLAALRAAGNDHTRIVTLDLNEPAALDMVKGGNVAALVADEAYNIGVTLARATAASLTGKQAEPFIVVDSIAVTKDTVKEGWLKSLNADVPATIAEAMK